MCVLHEKLVFGVYYTLNNKIWQSQMNIFVGVSALSGKLLNIWSS